MEYSSPNFFILKTHYHCHKRVWLYTLTTKVLLRADGAYQYQVPFHLRWHDKNQCCCEENCDNREPANMMTEDRSFDDVWALLKINWRLRRMSARRSIGIISVVDENHDLATNIELRWRIINICRVFSPIHETRLKSRHLKARIGKCRISWRHKKKLRNLSWRGNRQTALFISNFRDEKLGKIESCSFTWETYGQ